jgi:threonine dehydrogenase-like Zn-dependent dehydrogenase
MSAAQMQAAVVTAPRTVLMTRTALPEPGETEVRVRLEGCGVCGSNLAPWEGRPWFRYPFAPGELGHEGWGYIDALGPRVEHLKAGQRVACLSFRAYAEYDLASDSAVVPLPPGLADKPFPGEALACAMNVFKRSEVRTGHTVAVIGIGFLGALLTGLCQSAGARVLAISRRRFALETARKMGAAETLPLDDAQSVIESVRSLTGGCGCDCVIEAAGQQSTLDLSGELTCERGRLVIAGYHQDGLRQVNMQLWNWRGLDVINAHERDPAFYARGMQAAVNAVVGGKLNPFPLYTHSFRLEQLDSALEAMRQRPGDFMKALVTL